MTSPVCSSKDRPKLTDSCPIIRVGKGDPQEIRLCSAGLRAPVVPAIRCSENYASSANNRPGIRIGKETPTRGLKAPLGWLVQVLPPFVVLKIRPVTVLKSNPTAVPLFVSVKETPQRSSAVPLTCGLQWFPPSVVLRIVPELPTAVPLFASVKETPRSVLVVPLVWLIHVFPPFVVRRTVPPSPTAVPLFASVKETSSSELVVTALD